MNTDNWEKLEKLLLGLIKEVFGERAESIKLVTNSLRIDKEVVGTELRSKRVYGLIDIHSYIVDRVVWKPEIIFELRKDKENGS